MSILFGGFRHSLLMRGRGAGALRLPARLASEF